MGGNDPLVTVLMPVYNGERFLNQAVGSILKQTLRDFEFLVIDDGSTDRSRQLIGSFRDPRIRVLRNERTLGIAASLNMGIDAAVGTYIARMDCDDVSLPGRLEKQVHFMESHPDIGICGSWVSILGPSVRHVFRHPVSPTAIRASLFFRNVVSHSSVMMRRGFVDSRGLRYNPDYVQVQDWELWVRASMHTQLANIPEPLVKYRVNRQSIGNRHKDQQIAAILRVYRTNLHDLGVEADDDEIRIHLAISSYTYPEDRDFVTKAEAWLLRILRANREAGAYPEPAFSAILADRWLSACLAGTRPTGEIHRFFDASILGRELGLTMKQRVRFHVLLAARWGKIRRRAKQLLHLTDAV